MRALLFFCLLPVLSLAQAGDLGSFTNSDDVGAPPLKGSAEFDRTTGNYKITGSGSDIWGKADQFHYVWREMSGNFSMTANAKFLTSGIGHRKAVMMLRQSLETDSPFLQLAIHGDGTPAIQFRNTKGDNTNTVDFPIEGPGTWQLKLAREGSTVTFWIAKDGGSLRELGHTTTQLGSPILVGLGVSSHTQAAVNTVLFSDVSVQETGKLGLFTNAADVGRPAINGTAEYKDGQYRITGSGANIWGKQDQFQYVWREITGDFRVKTRVQITGDGSEHRKAGIMVRQSLDPDAAYADVMIHGNGMPALQWRSKRDDNTNTFDLPFDHPGTFTIKLVRTGVKIYMYVGKEGAEPEKIANTEVTFQGPVLLGLAVCAHQADATTTALFSDVSIESQSSQQPVAATNP